MHGLINRAIQCFIRDTFGAAVWARVTREARLGFDSFEPMLRYDSALTEAVLIAATTLLQRPRETFLEDMGTYLVSHPNVESLRRLLRFGGANFTDFLLSLEDLQGRGRLAVPDLDLPTLTLTETEAETYILHCQSPVEGAGHVIMGLLRAMADDYGVLVLLEHCGVARDGEAISVHVLDTGYSAGREFDLAIRVS